MKDEDFKRVFEIYEVLSSGRIDMAKKMMEKFLGINPNTPSTDTGPEAA